MQSDWAQVHCGVCMTGHYVTTQGVAFACSTPSCPHTLHPADLVDAEEWVSRDGVIFVRVVW